jgi:hypothetical protein
MTQQQDGYYICSPLYCGVMLSVYYIKKEIPSHQPEPPPPPPPPSFYSLPLQSQKEVMASCSTFHRVIKYRQEEKEKEKKKKEFSCGCCVVWKAIQE